MCVCKIGRSSAVIVHIINVCGGKHLLLLFVSFRFHFARFIESETHITNAGLHAFHSMDEEDSMREDEYDNGQRRKKKKQKLDQ